uniref:Ficolin-1-like n=1 Tax=Phallusia mammillata TaxID=59560 RepID=A0A6F9DDC3_9ASCI|nr:ficolin-1-like [Phallusia mammillata]
MNKAIFVAIYLCSLCNQAENQTTYFHYTRSEPSAKAGQSCSPGAANTVNDCVANACKNNGTCVDAINGFYCTCKANYTGARCETYFNQCKNSLCKNNSTCIPGDPSYTCKCPAGFAGKYCQTVFTNCWTGNWTGNYQLKSGTNVVCNKGWLVFQRRYDGSVDFEQYWTNYTQGFGSTTGEFWWGLENLYQATKAYTCSQCKLQVELKSLNNISGYAVYSNFSVGAATDKYRLCVDGYSGTAGNAMNGLASFTVINNQRFTTRDQDHDLALHVNCGAASRRTGGWWFNSCSHTPLNGNYIPSPPNRYFYWGTFDNATQLVFSKIMTRCA